MSDVTYHLRDLEPRLAEAWRDAFQDVEGVTVSCGDIWGVRADAIVSPANSFGFMDGGIDLVYSRRFGWDLQARLQNRLLEEFAGELLVGQAVIIPTEDAEYPWLVSAPTMRVPENISRTVNAYLAFRAVLRSVRDFNRDIPGAITSVLCPGLGTATGELPFRTCARQMRAAWDTALLPLSAPPSVNAAMNAHYPLLATVEELHRRG